MKAAVSLLLLVALSACAPVEEPTRRVRTAPTSTSSPEAPSSPEATSDGGGETPSAAPTMTPSPTPRRTVLVFTRTTGFRHDSIPAAVQAVRSLEREGWSVTHTEDPSVFTPARLRGFGAVVFLLTTGDPLEPVHQRALEGYIRGGGGFAGVHSASDTHYGWAWYGGLVGAYFRSHPAVQAGRLILEDREHASTSHLGPEWARTDEWYDFRENPRPKVRVLARIDEGSYEGGSMGTDHPISWCHGYDGGRSWYTAGGHTVESWSEDSFVRHVLGGIRSVVGSPACT